MDNIPLIHDVIEEEYYTDRHGNTIPNKIDGAPIYFLNRLEDIFLGCLEEHQELCLSEPQKNLLMEYYISVNNCLVTAPRTLYKDSNLSNSAINELAEQTELDFEFLRLMPPQIELINKLEWADRDYLTEEQKTRLIHSDIERRQRAGIFIDPEYFLLVYENSGIDRHLYLVGYRARECVHLNPEQRIMKRKEQIHRLKKARAHAAVLEAHPKSDQYLRECYHGINTILDEILDLLFPS